MNYEDSPCCYGAGHHPNCPNADDWEGDERPEMSRGVLIDLAGAGDEAAMRVLANAVDFDDTISEIDEATDEEIAEWYLAEQRETA